MQFNAAPSCTLFAKVSVKVKPYSNDPVSILVNSAMFPTFTSAKAQFFVELPLHVTTLADIESALARMQTQANAETVSVIKFQPKVSKFIAE